MGRLRRTHIRSFGHGLMLAALPVLAFVGVDYLVAPPPGQDPGHDANRSSFARDGVVSARDAGPSSGLQTTTAGQPTSGKLTTASLPGRTVNLTASIQNELRRVGCYSGEADGTWSEGTRMAMRAFNSSVHVNLATDKPDYILLTLLQGHNSKACSRSCDSVSATGGACIDKSIEARALPPATLATRSPNEHFRGEARTSSVSVAGPILLSKPTPAVRPAHPAATAAVPPNRWVAEVNPAAPAADAQPLITGSTNRSADAVSAASPKPLPGRMTVGALPTPEARPGSGSAADISDVRPVVRRTAPPPVAARSAKPERRAPERSSRLNRTFTDLSRASP